MRTKTKKNGVTFSMKEDHHRFFFPKDFVRFMEELKDRQRFDILFLLYTGARINEIRNVTVNDVDFINSRITLRVTKTKARKGEKMGRVRILPIPDKLVKLLKKRVRQLDLKPTDTFKLKTTSGIKKLMLTTATRIGLQNPQDFSAHNLRKTLEVWLMAIGVSDMKLLAHFGHDMRTAMKHYISTDVFSYEEKVLIRDILGNLYDERRMY